MALTGFEAVGLVTRRLKAFSSEADKGAVARGPLEVLAWFLLAPAALWAFGAVVGSGVYVAAFRTGFGRTEMRVPRELLRTAVIAVLFSVFIYLGFRVGLSVRLPRARFF